MKRKVYIFLVIIIIVFAGCSRKNQDMLRLTSERFSAVVFQEFGDNESKFIVDVDSIDRLMNINSFSLTENTNEFIEWEYKLIFLNDYTVTERQELQINESNKNIVVLFNNEAITIGTNNFNLLKTQYDLLTDIYDSVVYEILTNDNTILPIRTE